MAEIIPAILEKDFREIRRKLGILRGLCRTVQIDLCDGIFVKNKTWFSDDPDFIKIVNDEEAMPNYEDFNFEIDLMVADAVPNFDLYTKLGARRVIFHLEAVGDTQEFTEFLEGIDPYDRDEIQIGVAINPGTPIEKIFPVVPNSDFVQVMGIAEIGVQQGTFDERALSHLRALREKFPGLEISVDGGVNLENAPSLLAAGAKKLVVGSAIWKSNDIIDTIKTFQKL